MNKYAYVAVGIIVGWLTVGIALAGTFGKAFWTEWQQAHIINLLESIERNTR